MKFLKTISVLAMAFLVLLSSSSFMVGIHFCAGEVQHMALFSQAEKCAMENSLPPCHKHLTAPCCDDETIVHEGEGFKASISKIEISLPLVLEAELSQVILSEIIPSVSVVGTRYHNYDPPLRSYDITVAHRVFLI